MNLNYLLIFMVQRYPVGYFRIPIVIQNANKDWRKGRICHFLFPSPYQDFERKKMRTGIKSERVMGAP